MPNRLRVRLRMTILGALEKLKPSDRKGSDGVMVELGDSYPMFLTVFSNFIVSLNPYKY